MKDQQAKQAIFDYVVKFAATMPGKSENNSRCLYRSENGNRCFIGALMPDTLYKPVFEGMSAPDALLIALGRGFMEPEEARFLTQLQAIHDDCEMDDWHDEFAFFAMRHGLTYGGA